MKKTPTNYWSFTPRQVLSIGIVALVLIVLKVVVYLVEKQPAKVEYIVNQEEMNRIQKEMDSLYAQSQQLKIYPFNPNYLTKEKSFQLEMSLEEFERLQLLRNQGKFVNSNQEFQQITQVSDEWMKKYVQYFKFPDWVNKKSQAEQPSKVEKISIVVKDLNRATKEDFLAIKGVGEATAMKLLNEREKLGGFVSVKQLDFIYGISSEALKNLKQSFKLKSKPAIEKINLQTASIEELARVPYLTKTMARQIVIERSKQDEPLTKQQFQKIKGLPLEKIEIILLYLTF
ncbi:ComEA family DNA-binding protein [Capnocytophaga sp. ARDL2]|uniref:ComEA family DNA-binding protein n=1 Tax=Capnocytophaga sp. ARDL2 TaxID=3238809 RepID=UPI00355602A2